MTALRPSWSSETISWQRLQAASSVSSAHSHGRYRRSPVHERHPCPGGVGREHPDLRILLLVGGSVYWRATPTAHHLASGLRKVLTDIVIGFARRIDASWQGLCTVSRSSGVRQRHDPRVPAADDAA
jgi:hypothetical protein